MRLWHWIGERVWFFFVDFGKPFECFVPLISCRRCFCQSPIHYSLTEQTVNAHGIKWILLHFNAVKSICWGVYTFKKRPTDRKKKNTAWLDVNGTNLEICHRRHLAWTFDRRRSLECKIFNSTRFIFCLLLISFRANPKRWKSTYDAEQPLSVSTIQVCLFLHEL